MDQFERENTNTANRTMQPAEEPRWEKPAQSSPEKPKRRRGIGMLVLVMLLALVVAGVLGWLWYQQNGQVDDLESKLSSSNNKLLKLETEAATKAELNADSVTTDTTDSESDAIVKVSLAYAQADVSSSDSKLSAQVMYNKGGFANVSISVVEGAGGTGLILKKVADQWVVVFSGQDNPPQAVIDQYGIPKAALLNTN